MKLYQHIARTLLAMRNCQQTGNVEWQLKHFDAINKLVRDFMPSGSGFDNGTYLSTDAKPNRLVFTTAYHHMNDGGYYDGWTYHSVIVTPSLGYGFDIRVTGRNRNDIKDLIVESFDHALKNEEGYGNGGFDKAYARA